MYVYTVNYPVLNQHFLVYLWEYTVYIYYVYINAYTCIYFRKKVLFLYIKYIYLYYKLHSLATLLGTLC